MTLNCKTIKLQKGSKGIEVKELQEILQKQGYYKAKIDGEYGNLTEEAVKKYQKANKLTVDGWVGTETCKKLQQLTNNKVEANDTTGTVLKKGKTGDKVKQLQQKLQQLGYYTSEVDGDYGTKTVNAVKQYQTYYNLVVDGVCGELTQKVLNETQILKETSNSKKLSKR